MATLKAVNFVKPGSYGLNTQDDIAADQALRFAATASNAVVDSADKMTSRKYWTNQTTGATLTLNTIFVHRQADATDVVLTAGSGAIWSGVGTLTARHTYQAGAQYVDVGGAKAGATATGLANSAEAYGMTVAVDGGAAQQITVTGSAAQTYTTLLAEINTDLTGASCVLRGGNLFIFSDTTGVTSTIAITAAAGTASNNLLTTLTNYVAVRTATAGSTTTANNWQFASLSNVIFAAQAGHYFHAQDESTYAYNSFTGQPWTSSPNVVIAAYGRLWVADDAAGNNRHTIWWSNLLDGTAFTGGDSGSLSLINAWPAGQDSIVALAAFGGRLIVLGRNTILMYTLPADNDPASVSLTDTVVGLGCVARDSVVITDNGLYFLSDNGIYKIDKLGQVTGLLSLPLMSKLVNDDVLADIVAETATNIRAGYYPTEGYYALTFPTSAVTYCVHTRRMLPELNVPIVTKWTHADVAQRGFAANRSGNWYTAGVNGVHEYTGYVAPSTAFSFDFYTQWNNFQAEDRLKILKTAVLVLEAASGQTGTFKWLNDYTTSTNSFSFTCDAAEFAENPGIGSVRIPLFSTANVSKFGFSITPVAQVSLHQLRVLVNPGKVKA